MRTIAENSVPYAESLELQTLGINNEQVTCFGNFINEKLYLGFFHSTHCTPDTILGVTYGQAFDFFREKFRIEGWVQPYLSPDPRQCEAKFWYGGRTPTEGTSVGKYDTHLEAELECVRAIIEFIKYYSIYQTK
jgi:hypothetical protein